MKDAASSTPSISDRTVDMQAPSSQSGKREEKDITDSNMAYTTHVPFPPNNRLIRMRGEVGALKTSYPQVNSPSYICVVETLIGLPTPENLQAGSIHTSGVEESARNRYLPTSYHCKVRGAAQSLLKVEGRRATRYRARFCRRIRSSPPSFQTS